jgi:type IV pilus assembly protein PilB
MTTDAEESARRLAETHGLRFVDLTQSALAPGAASLLSEAMARRHHAVPIGRRLGTPVIAVADPGDLFAMDALRQSVGREFVAVVARPDQVTRAIRQLYRPQDPEPEDELMPPVVPTVEAAAPAPETMVAAAVEPPTASVAVAEEPTPVAEAEAAPGAATQTVEAGADDASADGLAGAATAEAESADGGANGAVGTAGAKAGGSRRSGADKGSADGPVPSLTFEPVEISEDAGSANGHKNGNGSGSDGRRKGGRGSSDRGAGTTVAEPEEAAHEVAETIETAEATAEAAAETAEATAEAAAETAEAAAETAEAAAGPSGDGKASTEAVADVPLDLTSLVDSIQTVAEPGEAEAPEASPDEVSVSLEESLREILSPPTRERPPAEPGAEGVAEAGVAPSPDGAEAAPVAEGELPPVPAGYGLISVDEVEDAIALGPPLARVLVESGRVSAEEMSAALREHQATGESLARYLYNRHLATEDDLVRAMAQEVGLEFVDLSNYDINATATTLIPEPVARHHVVLPIDIKDGVPIVAMANPTDVFAMDDLRTIMGRNFTPVVATRSQIAMHLRFMRSSDTDVEDIAEEATSGISGAGAAGFELESLTAVVEDAPIVRYVNLLILQALNERASDIHIEPTPKRLRIRFRIDGVMHDATSASPSIQSAVISRLKVLGEMDITEHRIPQEGRVSLSVSDRQIDLRLAMLPSMYGETCVMRLLDKSASIRSLPELGFDDEILERYSHAYRHPYGVILVTGPTGAGKTTTLYATLQEVMSTDKSVVTVEDPVEYQIDAITQVQINKKAGLLFSTALKSILRADPDVVLIGEIRDAETATIAMEAALSGHLVLSTLHTNTAAATPLRLTEMGIEPFLVTSALSTVLTQRLCRVLCEQCKEPFDSTEKDFTSAGYKPADLEGFDISTLYRAVGCRSCGQTGYRGRVVLSEVMTVSEEIDRMIIEQESIVNIERTAVEQGMRTLRKDGLLKALSGATTLEEVLRVVV